MNRNRSTLLEEVKKIQNKNSSITGAETIRELSKKGWTLNHYRNIFFNVHEMNRFFNL